MNGIITTHPPITMTSQITSLTINYSTVYSDTDQRKHQSSASLSFVWGIHREPMNSPHKWPVTRKMFPFHDVYMLSKHQSSTFLVLWHSSIRHNFPEPELNNKYRHIYNYGLLSWMVGYLCQKAFVGSVVWEANGSIHPDATMVHVVEIFLRGRQESVNPA